MHNSSVLLDTAPIFRHLTLKLFFLIPKEIPSVHVTRVGHVWCCCLFSLSFTRVELNEKCKVILEGSLGMHTGGASLGGGVTQQVIFIHRKLELRTDNILSP